MNYHNLKAISLNETDSELVLFFDQRAYFYKEPKLNLLIFNSLNEDTTQYIKKLNAPQLISCGSSLKFLYIADNKADIYPRFGPTMEWDTAAAHSILKALDIMVTNLEDKKELYYNKKNLLNPYFLIKP